MKKYLIAFVLICTIVVAQNKAPKITSDKPDHDFGEILEGQTVAHDFEIANTGTADLKIEQVRATCGCTAVQPSKKLLKPGEKTTIKAEFDSKGRMGLQQKSIYVFTNDPQNQQFRLSFTAMVVEKISKAKDGKNPKLVLDTYEYDFGNVKSGSIVNAKIGFVNSGRGVLEIIDVKTSCGCTAALLSSKKLQPNESGTLRIELDTEDYQGLLTRVITLYSNDPQQPNQTITLSVNIEKRKS